MSASPPPDRLLAARVFREEAAREGFSRAGIARSGEPPEFARYRAWIAAGHHAGMRYLAQTEETRRSPESLLPGARSVVCLASPHSAAPHAVGSQKIARR